MHRLVSPYHQPNSQTAKQPNSQTANDFSLPRIRCYPSGIVHQDIVVGFLANEVTRC
ncbi:hypothetical protein DFP81_102254 [Marinomonas pollencensis]|uniref:Uncharacterized protein n=1 Tax=Marinomonas pollencensis TaxID=491954 RepID=A0A3E0DRI4_9GAMM|nr:hypothetical protein DFP81_102254 [Marinomonas pollencensis]